MCKRVNEEQKSRIAKLTSKNCSLSQEVDTLQKHQESLRGTIASHVETISAQQKIIEANDAKLSSQKKLIADQEIELQSHCELAISFMDECLEEEQETPELDAGKATQAVRVKEMYDAAKERVSKFTVENNKLGKIIKEKEEELKKKQEELDVNSSQVRKMAETILCLEAENQTLAKEINHSREVASAAEENTVQLKEKFESLKRSHEDMKQDLASAKQTVIDNNATAKFNKLMEEKDQEILDLQESVAYSEKEVQDAHQKLFNLEAKQEIMNEQWSHDKIALVDYRDKFSELTIKCQELDRKNGSLAAQLNQSRSLNGLIDSKKPAIQPPQAYKGEDCSKASDKNQIGFQCL